MNKNFLTFLIIFFAFNYKFNKKKRDCVLIKINSDDQITAKLFDFTNSLELNDSDNFDSKIRDEFYRFGQVCFKCLIMI